MRTHILWKLPYLLQVIIGFFIYRKVSTMLHSQGASRFSSEEIATFRLDIWQNINALLVDSRKDREKCGEPFWVLGGVGPSEADAALFGSITASLVTNAYVLKEGLLVA